jgi:AraC-like DNA-binding protein
MEGVTFDANPMGMGTLAQMFPGVRMHPRRDLAGARMGGAAIGAGRALWVENVADRVERAVVGRDETSGFVKVLLQARGESLVHHRGQKVRLRAGDLTFLDGASGFTIELGREYRQVLFQLPRDVVARRHARLLGLVGRCLQSSDPANAMVFDALSAMIQHLPALSEERRARTATAVICLLGALEPPEVTGSDSLRRLRRALADMETHLADPQLSAETLASLQSISRRRMHAVFAEHGVSLARLIWSLRLERIAEDLRDPSQRARRLIDIALSWGFNDQAHFSRAFRRKFGESPSAHRRRASTA